MDDAFRYSRRLIRSLIEAGFFDEFQGRWIDTPQLLELRAHVERTGDVDGDNWHTVIDIERALSALQSRHPEGAAVVAAVVWCDMTLEQLAEVFGYKRNWARILNKSIAWMAEFNNGKPISSQDREERTCESAWRKAR